MTHLNPGSGTKLHHPNAWGVPLPRLEATWLEQPSRRQSTWTTAVVSLVAAQLRSGATRWKCLNSWNVEIKIGTGRPSNQTGTENRNRSSRKQKQNWHRRNHFQAGAELVHFCRSVLKCWRNPFCRGTATESITASKPCSRTEQGHPAGKW